MKFSGFDYSILAISGALNPTQLPRYPSLSRFAEDRDSRYFLDVYQRSARTERYISDAALDGLCEELNLEQVPVLYRGPYSKEVVDKLTSGKETLSGQELHIREGIVIKPAEERRDVSLGRVILKSVSESYLLRKGGTEYQ